MLIWLPLSLQPFSPALLSIACRNLHLPDSPNRQNHQQPLNLYLLEQTRRNKRIKHQFPTQSKPNLNSMHRFTKKAKRRWRGLDRTWKYTSRISRRTFIRHGSATKRSKVSPTSLVNCRNLWRSLTRRMRMWRSTRSASTLLLPRANRPLTDWRSCNWSTTWTP